jgi:hypothetical protein
MDAYQSKQRHLDPEIRIWVILIRLRHGEQRATGHHDHEARPFPEP